MVTAEVRPLRRLQLLRRWFLGRRSNRMHHYPVTPAVSSRRPSPNRRLGWVIVSAMMLALSGIAIGAVRAPVGQANGGSKFELVGDTPNAPAVFSTHPSNKPVLGPVF